MLFKKISVLVAAFGIIGLHCHAQDRAWDTGPITWQDFQGTPDIENQRSLLVYDFGHDDFKDASKDTSIVYARAYALLDPSSSWVKPEFKNNSLLLYNQVMFDIVELHRREYQQALHTARNKKDLKLSINKIMDDNDYMVEQYAKQTDYGKNSDVVKEWDSKINNSLKGSKSGDLPEIKDLKYGMGFDIGGGVSSSLGEIGSHFSSAPFVSVALNFSYSRASICFEGTTGRTKVKNEFTHNETWLPGTKVTSGLFNTFLRYPVLVRPKVKISPLAGYTRSRFTSQEQVGLQMTSHGASLGVTSDFIIKRTVNYSMNMMNLRSRTEYGIRLNVYGTMADYGEGTSGSLINVSLQFSSYNRFIAPVR